MTTTKADELAAELEADGSPRPTSLPQSLRLMVSAPRRTTGPPQSFAASRQWRQSEMS